MYWILIAFIAPILHGFANILDNYLTNKLFKNIWTLTFYSAFFNVLFLPLVLFIEIPGIPPASTFLFFLIVGAIDVLYLFPYYKALQSDDTSIVTTLFSLGKIFVPIFAFLFVGEKLQLTQYLGFFIIILGSVSLTLNNHGALRLNKSFFYMLLCSLLLAIEAVVYKYLFENVGWSTGFVWATVVSAIFALSFLFIPKIRRNIYQHTRDLRHNAPVFAFEEFLTFGGSVASTYAISLVSVTLEKSVSAFQPLFVLIYALVLGRFFPHLFREHVDRRSVFKKFLIFAIMIVGIVLVI
ncbi:MAG: DMT family transporter [Patescibacteria group bacterium]